MKAYKPRHILIATDLRGVAERGIRWGVAVATRFDASVTLLYADRFEPPISLLQSSIGGSYAAIEERRTEAHARVSELAERLIPSGLRHEVMIVRDLPANAIIEAADRLGVDMIVMGPRARRGWHAILGSETELVVYQTQIPLLAVRPSPDNDEGPPEVRRVLCPVNYSAVAFESLHYATTIAHAFEAELLLVHVEEDADDSIERLEAWIPPHLPIPYRICEKPRGKSVAEQVIASITAEGADLLVVGAQHRTFADSTVIGMTTTRLLRYSPVPVLTVFRR